MPSNFKFVTIIYYKKEILTILYDYSYIKKKEITAAFFKFFSISDPAPIIIVIFFKRNVP